MQDNTQNFELIREYLMNSIDKVLKEPRGYYKYPFIDPGAAYDGNLWDWDTFWAVYSLINIAENCPVDASFKEKLIDHGKGNVLNFLSYQLPDGYIPMMVNQANEEVPYLNMKHNHGEILNMHKPFLCQQTVMVSEFSGSYDWIKPHFEQLLKYFECYDKYYYFEHCGLYVWADDVMIGVDNDPSTFGRPRFSTAGIYLNSFMVSELRAMAQIARNLGKADTEKRFADKAQKLTDAVQNECWDNRDKIFYSVDADIKLRPYDWFHKGLGVFWNTLFIKVRSWSSFLPLLSGIATKEQAAHLAKHAMDPDTYLGNGGIRSLSIDEKMYNLDKTGNPSNWLGPIWILTQYAVFRGLMNYGYKDEARIIADRTLQLLGDDLRKNGTLHEYYNPETCAPIINPGFVDWNILALNMACELDGKPPVSRFFK